MSEAKNVRSLAKMEDLMNYSWGPVTNKYNAFVNKCTVLRPNVNCRVCPHFSHDGFTYAEDILRGYFELQNFEARQDDIYLISFPKTGTTWLQEIVYCTLYGIEKAKEDVIDNRVPFFEIFPGGMRGLQSYASPRLFKSHFSYSALPKSIKQKGCKIIYITRNPKDTIVSMHHFYRAVTSFDFSGSLEDFIDLFLNDNVINAPYPTHLLEFWNRRRYPNILFLSYEDLQLNLPEEVRGIAEFLGKSLSDEAVEAIAQHCSFQQMSVNPKTNYSYRDHLGWRNLNETKFMRKGKVGDWMEHFSEKMNNEVDEWIEKHFGHSDIKFIYHI